MLLHVCVKMFRVFCFEWYCTSILIPFISAEKTARTAEQKKTKNGKCCKNACVLNFELFAHSMSFFSLFFLISLLLWFGHPTQKSKNEKLNRFFSSCFWFLIHFVKFEAILSEKREIHLFSYHFGCFTFWCHCCACTIYSTYDAIVSFDSVVFDSRKVCPRKRR